MRRKKMRYNYYATSKQGGYFLHKKDFATVVKAVKIGGFKSVAAFAASAVFEKAQKVLAEHNIIEKNKD